MSTLDIIIPQSPPTLTIRQIDQSKVSLSKRPKALPPGLFKVVQTCENLKARSLNKNNFRKVFFLETVKDKVVQENHTNEVKEEEKRQQTDTKLMSKGLTLMKQRLEEKWEVVFSEFEKKRQRKLEMMMLAHKRKRDDLKARIEQHKHNFKLRFGRTIRELRKTEQQLIRCHEYKEAERVNQMLRAQMKSEKVELLKKAHDLYQGWTDTVEKALEEEISGFHAKTISQRSKLAIEKEEDEESFKMKCKGLAQSMHHQHKVCFPFQNPSSSFFDTKNKMEFVQKRVTTSLGAEKLANESQDTRATYIFNREDSIDFLLNEKKANPSSSSNNLQLTAREQSATPSVPLNTSTIPSRKARPSSAPLKKSAKIAPTPKNNQNQKVARYNIPSLCSLYAAEFKNENE